MAWANETKSLTTEMANMHKDRAKYIRQLKNDTQQMSYGYNAERAQMKAGLLASFDAWDKARAGEVADLRSVAKVLLKELNEGDKARAKEVNDLKAALQTFLTKFREEDIAGFIKENKQRAQDTAKFKVDIANLIKGFKKEHEEASAAWKDLISKMSKTGEMETEPEKPKATKPKKKSKK
jgi:hypothetical protein